MQQNAENADLILFNTCAVRENAEDRVFGNIGALKKLKQRNKNLIICVCGCMARQEHVAKRLKQSFPYVDLVFGPQLLWKFPQLLLQKLTTRQPDDSQIEVAIASLKAVLPEEESTSEQP